MRCSMAVVALLVVLPSAPVASGASGQVLAFRLQSDGGIVVPVTIDGAGPFRFLIDTGSSRTIVSDVIARELGLLIVGQTMMVTPGGNEPRPLAPLLRVAVGEGPPATVLAMVSPADAFAGGHAVDGIIGQDILARRTFTIDYERQILVWHPISLSAMPGTRLSLESTNGGLLVSLPQRRELVDAAACALAAFPTVTTLRLIPDSGADGFVLFERAGRLLPPMTSLETAGLKTLSGQRAVRRAVIETIDVGAIRLHNQSAVVVEDREPDAALGDGLLPLHLFARVTFSGPQKLLIVEAR